MSLKQMLAEHGITTYETLVERCERMGVTPPERSEFAATNPPVVNSPAEGVVVIDAKPELEAPDLSLLALPETSEEPTEPSQKKPRKKREVQHNEESN